MKRHCYILYTFKKILNFIKFVSPRTQLDCQPEHKTRFKIGCKKKNRTSLIFAIKTTRVFQPLVYMYLVDNNNPPIPKNQSSFCKPEPQVRPLFLEKCPERSRKLHRIYRHNDNTLHIHTCPLRNKMLQLIFS